jgi:hypothetical protein
MKSQQEFLNELLSGESTPERVYSGMKKVLTHIDPSEIQMYRNRIAKVSNPEDKKELEDEIANSIKVCDFAIDILDGKSHEGIFWGGVFVAGVALTFTPIIILQLLGLMIAKETFLTGGPRYVSLKIRGEKKIRDHMADLKKVQREAAAIKLKGERHA